MPSVRVHDILRDAEGGTWFALDGAGLAHLPPHWRDFASFRHLPGEAASLSSPRVRAIALDEDNAAWVATGERRARSHRSGQRHDRAAPARDSGSHRAISPRSCRSARHASGSAIATAWCCSDSNGASSVEMPVDLTRTDALPPPGYVTSSVRAPTATSGPYRSAAASRCCAARSGGRRACCAATRRPTRRSATPTSPRSRSTRRQRHGSRRRAASNVSTGSRACSSPIAGIPHERIHALGFAADGELWLHRVGALERYRIDGVTALRSLRFEATDGWPAMEASAMAVASDGAVWVTSSRGLWRVDPKTRAIRRFDASDGLPSSEFRFGALARGQRRHAIRRHRGRRRSRSIRRTCISIRRRRRCGCSASACGAPGASSRSIRPRRSICSYDDLDFSVAVRALSYANPSSNRYRFQLAGFDPEWIDSERGERTYSQLPAGEYTLQVRAANADGAWSALAPIAITVARRAWARPPRSSRYALAVIAVALALLYAYRLRIKRRHALVARRNAAAKRRAARRGEVELPRHDGSRDPHADDRRARHERAPALDAARRAPARLCQGDPSIGRAAAAARQRQPRHRAHRGRQVRARRSRARSGRARCARSQR